MEPIPIPIEGPPQITFPRLIAMVDNPANTPPLTVEFGFTVEKHPDAMSGMGLISRDENIEIPNFIFSMDGQPASADDQRDAIHGHKELINDGILRRHGCVAHHYSPHGHQVPIGIVQISDTNVGDLDVFETALENLQYYEDFEATLLEFMEEQENVRCYRLEEELAQQELKEQHHDKWAKKRRKRRNRENRIRRKSPNRHGLRGRHGRQGSARSLHSEQSSARDETRNIREEMALDEHRERGDIELAEPHSHALDEINALRKAEGEPSWQSVMNQDAPRMGRMSSQHDDMKVHRNTATGPSKMTQTMERRLFTESDAGINSSSPNPVVEVRKGRGPLSYLSGVNAMGMLAVAIAYIPYLPLWIAVCMVLLTGMCVFCIYWVIQGIKKRVISGGQSLSYQHWIPPPLSSQNWIPPQLNAPRHSHMKSESAPSQGVVACVSMDDALSSDYYSVVTE